MYSKVFQQIFDSSISEDHVVRHVFMDLLVLADRHGDVDMTLSAIARRTNVPIAIVTHAISKLCEPDPDSRTKDEEGRRLVLMDDHREWGWRIVNFSHYNAMRNEDARREYFREYKRKQRANAHSHLDENVQDSPHLSTTVNRESTVSTYAPAPTDAPTNLETKASPTSQISQFGKKNKSKGPLPTLPKGEGNKPKRVKHAKTKNERPGTSDAARRASKVLASIPGISLGIRKVGGYEGDSEVLPDAGAELEDLDPPALTPEQLEGSKMETRWSQFKLWLKRDLQSGGGAPLGLQEVRFGTLSPGESDWDYCFRDCWFDGYEQIDIAIEWIVSATNPAATQQGFKKYATRIQNILKQLSPTVGIRLRVQGAEAVRRIS